MLFRISQNKDLTAELRQHGELKQLYDEMIVKLADEKDHFEASLNQAELDKEELQTRNISLEKGLTEEQERMQVEEHVSYHETFCENEN